MTIMKIMTLAVLIVVCSFSCTKEQLGFGGDMAAEAVFEEPSFVVAESGFRVTELEPVVVAEGDMYASGILEYSKGGNVMAVVDFGDGTAMEKAKVYKDDQVFEIDLVKNGKKEGYYKVIVAPLVKAEDCDFEIVSGMIKFYNAETKMWFATVDFGDGVCDDTAMKVTMDGISTFSVSDYY